jgi:hypothetical protein
VGRSGEIWPRTSRVAMPIPLPLNRFLTVPALAPARTCSLQDGFSTQTRTLSSPRKRESRLLASPHDRHERHKYSCERCQDGCLGRPCGFLASFENGVCS